MTIHPTTLAGTIAAPPSKSVMQRACAAALLQRGTHVLRNAGESDDDEVMLQIIKQMGCIVERTGGEVRIENNGIVFPHSVHFGESALAARMMTPILALHQSVIPLDGSESLRRRPMTFFEEVLPQLGVEVALTDGSLPGTVKGPLVPKTLQVDASASSQTITGLIFAYNLAGAQDVRIMLQNLVSRPYIELTLDVLERMGITIPIWEGRDTLYWQDKDILQFANNIDFTIEGDWSSATFLLVAGAIGGPITVRGLDLFTAQADKAILQPLMDSGAYLSIQQEEITIRTCGRLKPFHFNATDHPDLFPPLVALAAFANGQSVIEGVSRLTHKESNRGLTLQEEFGKMGISIVLQDDLMIVEGGGKVTGGAISAHGDHRIAMACAVAASYAEGETSIDDESVVNKSYPNFWKDLQSLGAQTSITA